MIFHLHERHNLNATGLESSRKINKLGLWRQFGDLNVTLKSDRYSPRIFQTYIRCRSYIKYNLRLISITTFKLQGEICEKCRKKSLSVDFIGLRHNFILLIKS